MPERKEGVVPRLRFPEFRDAGEWEVKSLDDIAAIITKRVGKSKVTLLSVTSGVGLVSQASKFGKEIAGNQYKNYYVIENYDFAYNKSATNAYPEGFIAMYCSDLPGAVPNSIFTCFRVKKNLVNPSYLNYLFENNHHGKWLRKFVSVGARAHGALNVDNKYLMSMPVPIPPQPTSLVEQEKIADCLSSLDKVIELEAQKLEALKTHKKGLMQQLFPREGETTPRLRFPEFRNAGEWELKKIGQISENVTAGGTPSTSVREYWGGDIRWMSSGELNYKRVYEVQGRITENGLRNSSTKIIPKKCILIGLAGQGKTRGTVAMNMVELCINQSIAAIFPNDDVFYSDFLYHNLDNRYDELRSLSAGGGGRGGLNLQIIESLLVPLPRLSEQQKIADCLSSLDEVINLEAKKLETLKTHKKGLFKQLFPQEVDIE